MSNNTNTWLHPQAFLVGASIMAVIQFGKFLQSGITPGFIGYSVGSIIGGGLFFGVIGTYIYNNYPGSSSRKKISVILTIGAIFLIPIGIGIIGSYGNGTEERMSASDTIELMDIMSGDKVITQSTEPGDNVSFSVFMKYYASKFQEVANEFTNEINTSGLWNMISPENLTNIQMAKQSRKEVIKLEQSVSSYEIRSLDDYDQFGIDLSRRKDSDSQAAYKGYRDMKDHNIKITKQRYRIYKNQISTIGEILDLAISRPGEFYLNDSQLIVENQETLDLYNDYIDRLSSLNEQEDSLEKGEQQRLENVKNTLNNL